MTVEAVAPSATNEIVASVIDNGSGLTASAGNGAGFGLLGMRERVAALGGSLTVTSRSDAGGEGGLAIVARLPRPVQTGLAA